MVASPHDEGTSVMVASPHDEGTSVMVPSPHDVASTAPCEGLPSLRQLPVTFPSSHEQTLLRDGTLTITPSMQPPWIATWMRSMSRRIM